MSQEETDHILNRMNPYWTIRWCESSMCACLGCANKAGNVANFGMTRELWYNWLVRKANENKK